MIYKQMVGYLDIPKGHKSFDTQQSALLETGINPLSIFVRPTPDKAKQDIGLMSAIKACLPGAALFVIDIASIGDTANKRHEILKSLEQRNIELVALNQSCCSRTVFSVS